ncbi:uncharacterized protein [Paramormyrops kingsleyae]|uniref:uncharacterized protein n=1 Tax=Paramormyrops kingsleyae TaxID=1676925 RepID=UPI003B96F713
MRTEIHKTSRNNRKQAVVRSSLGASKMWTTACKGAEIDWDPVISKVTAKLPCLIGKEQEIRQKALKMLQNRREYLRRSGKKTGRTSTSLEQHVRLLKKDGRTVALGKVVGERTEALEVCLLDITPPFKHLYKAGEKVKWRKKYIDGLSKQQEQGAEDKIGKKKGEENKDRGEKTDEERKEVEEGSNKFKGGRGYEYVTYSPPKAFQPQGGKRPVKKRKLFSL